MTLSIDLPVELLTDAAVFRPLLLSMVRESPLTVPVTSMPESSISKRERPSFTLTKRILVSVVAPKTSTYHAFESSTSLWKFI